MSGSVYVTNFTDAYERHLNTFKRFPRSHQTALLIGLQRGVHRLVKKAKQPIQIRDPEMCQLRVDPEEKECYAALMTEGTDVDTEVDSDIEDYQDELAD